MSKTNLLQNQRYFSVRNYFHWNSRNQLYIWDTEDGNPLYFYYDSMDDDGVKTYRRIYDCIADDYYFRLDTIPVDAFYIALQSGQIHEYND